MGPDLIRALIHNVKFEQHNDIFGYIITIYREFLEIDVSWLKQSKQINADFLIHLVYYKKG